MAWHYPMSTMPDLPICTLVLGMEERIYDEWAQWLIHNSLGNKHCIDALPYPGNYGEKGEKNHLPIEQSDLDFKGLFQALSEFGCAGRILTESPEDALEGDAVLLKKLWMEISAETAD
jgi:sugar phosphate isomerase/epimerase